MRGFQTYVDNVAKPYVCPSHPRAMIRHTCDMTGYIMNGLPAGSGTTDNHRYFCADCGMELSAEPLMRDEASEAAKEVGDGKESA
jgi:hypothetical protein